VVADTTSDPNVGSRTPRVFISYACSDMAFADSLDAALTKQGFETFIDRRDIGPGEDWEKRIRNLILHVDTVVFVLSPDAVTSKTCLKEVDIASELKKRIQPILYRRVSAKSLPDALSQPQWIFFDDPARFDESLDKLVEALLTDIEWIRKHTKIGEEAQRWDDAGRPGPGCCARRHSPRRRPGSLGARAGRQNLPRLYAPSLRRAERRSTRRRQPRWQAR